MYEIITITTMSFYRNKALPVMSVTDEILKISKLQIKLFVVLTSSTVHL